ncbi:MAG: class A beta-lactamase [Burkholderiaceae bacterium]
MLQSRTRRVFLLSAAAVPVAQILSGCASEAARMPSAEADFAALERVSGGRLGVDAYDTADGMRIGYRAGERFPVCSTFKIMLAGAVLAQSERDETLLERRVTYGQSEVVSYSPVSGKHVADGMTVRELCDAAVRYSDNTAANLLIRLLGGPAAVTSFARSIGDNEFRLDRYETELNTAIPGDSRDTSTPAAMGRSLRALVLGDALPPSRRKLLENWLRNSTTGAHRIRAGIPGDWQAGDKTGSGDYGTTNDAALLWPPGRAPISLVVYYTQDEAAAKWKDDVIVSAARIAVNAWP